MKPFEVDVSSSYGAPMGRNSDSPGNFQDLPPQTLHVDRVIIDDGGYDDGGAYWGTGQPLYCFWVEGDGVNTDDITTYVRANNREEAIEQLDVSRDSVIEDKSYIGDELWNGFITALIWLEKNDLLVNRAGVLALVLDIDDEDPHWDLSESFAPSTTAYLKNICLAFERRFGTFLASAEDHLLIQTKESTAIEYAGHDLWLKITRSGGGFGDGDWDDDSEVIQFCNKISKPELYVGDDQLVYVSGHE